MGPAVILSDGDVVFQPHKVYRAGLFERFKGNVLIYVHKKLHDVEHRYPGDSYVIVDDKLRNLHAVKKVWGPRVTTVFVRPGHYAHDGKTLAQYPPADINLGGIAELLDYDLESLSGARSIGQGAQ